MTSPFEFTRSPQSHTQMLTDAYPSLSIKTKFIERIRVIDISFSTTYWIVQYANLSSRDVYNYHKCIV